MISRIGGDGVERGVAGAAQIGAVDQREGAGGIVVVQPGHEAGVEIAPLAAGQGMELGKSP
jgi:hypothetical protein